MLFYTLLLLARAVSIRDIRLRLAFPRESLTARANFETDFCDVKLSHGRSRLC